MAITSKNTPTVLYRRPLTLHQQVASIEDNPLSKRICPSLGMRGSMALEMHLYYVDDALP
jgi:hypothetical protein